MSLSLHNTLTGTVEQLQPISQDRVTLYTCGPTVYNELTVGNWTAYIRWDLLVRTLRINQYTVERVMNITDVGHLVSDADEGEDKMIKGARREGVTEWEVAERYTNRFLEGITQLGLIPPEKLTKATEHIDIQIKLIETLESKGFTYVIDDGVYFDTAKFPSYAHFAGLDLDAQKAGARVAFNDAKRSVSDFVLWRLTPPGETRSMEWESPWGKGIPGWHIECSAMAMQYLGDTIDIHTGGIDHIPVHHTNEIAQSEAATGAKFANIWLHANFLMVNGTKISKSLDNGYTLDDLTRKGFTPADLRMFMLQSHYRTESNFTWENISAAAARLKRWQDIAVLRHQLQDTAVQASLDADEVILRCKEAMDHDLSSPLALSVIDQAFDSFESTKISTLTADSLTRVMLYIGDALGIDLLSATPDIQDTVKTQIGERDVARAAKDWQAADLLRDKIAQSGVGINDTASGSTWYYL